MNPQTGGAGFKPPSHRSPIIIVLLVLLLLGTAGFAFWAFSGRQDYKNNSDAKAAVAVAAAKKTEDTAQLQHYNEELKKPYKTYTGPATYGSVSFNYPLTYSAYVDTTSSSQPIEGYFYPNVVPGTQSGTAFALRVELTQTPYSQLVTQFQESGNQNPPTIAAFVPPKMKGVANVQPGIMVTGGITQDSQGNPQNGAMLIIPVRDKTLQIYTQSTDFLSDFNNIVIPSLTFSP